MSSTLSAPVSTLDSSLTYERVYAFLAARYKRSRFEGRGEEYASTVAQHHLESVQKRGYGIISRHEGITGEIVFHDADLKIRDHAFFAACIEKEIAAL